MIIMTDRLRLRPAEPKDIDTFLRALNDWEIQQWLSRPPFPYERKDGEAFLAMVANNHATPHPTIFVIADRSSDAALGIASVDVEAGGIGVLGYWLDRAHWGRGIAKEAVGALLRHVSNCPDVKTIVAVADPENWRSQRVLATCGLTDCGLRDQAHTSRRGSNQVRWYELVVEPGTR